MSRLIRRMILAPAAAASLLFAAAGGVLADAESDVSVFNADGTAAGATVCAFYVEFEPVAGGESGAWELRDAGGTAVASGSYEVTASEGDREPNEGSWTLPNGTYTLLWDDEQVIDRSNRDLEIVVECADETPGPTPTPTPTFQQSVGAVTDEPDVTLPNTSALNQATTPNEAAWLGALLSILGLATLVLIMTPSRRTGRR